MIIIMIQLSKFMELTHLRVLDIKTIISGKVLCQADMDIPES